MKIRILIILALSSSLVFSQQNKLNSKSIEEFNTNLYSYLYLKDLHTILIESDYLINSWVYRDKMPDTPKKLRLIKVHSELLPTKLKQLDYLSTFWSLEEKEIYQEIKNDISDLKEHHEYIMNKLNSIKSYNDLMVLFEVTPMVEQGGETIETLKKIEMKLDAFKQNYYKYFNSYLPPLPVNEDISDKEIDPKMILIEKFISKFKLEVYMNDESDFKKIYDSYSLKELKLAISDDFKNESDFYLKYNNLLIELSK